MECKFHRLEYTSQRLELSFLPMEHNSCLANATLSSRERKCQSRTKFSALKVYLIILSEIVARGYADRYPLLTEIIKQTAVVNKEA